MGHKYSVIMNNKVYFTFIFYSKAVHDMKN